METFVLHETEMSIKTSEIVGFVFLLWILRCDEEGKLGIALDLLYLGWARVSSYLLFIKENKQQQEEKNGNENQFGKRRCVISQEGELKWLLILGINLIKRITCSRG